MAAKVSKSIRLPLSRAEIACPDQSVHQRQARGSEPHQRPAANAVHAVHGQHRGENVHRADDHDVLQGGGNVVAGMAERGAVASYWITLIPHPCCMKAARHQSRIFGHSRFEQVPEVHPLDFAQGLLDAGQFPVGVGLARRCGLGSRGPGRVCRSLPASGGFRERREH